MGQTTVQKGEQIAFAKVDSEAAEYLAALYLVHKDFEFAGDCFEEALEHGIPDAHNLYSRAFLNSGVIAYARPFKSDVRQLQMTPEAFDGMNPVFDRTIHEYIVNLRSKHIAHSVNEFDYCRTIAAVVGTNETGWRDGAGIGNTDTRTIGLSGELVEQALKHIRAIVGFLAAQIEAKRPEVYKEFAEKFAKDRKWEMAPAGRIPKRENAGKRRSDD